MTISPTLPKPTTTNSTASIAAYQKGFRCKLEALHEGEHVFTQEEFK